MAEPKRVSSLDDLATGSSDYVITNPENGDEFIFKLKSLTPDETAELRKHVKQPKPKVKEFTKDQFGRPTPVYDEEDPEYLYQRQLSSNMMVYLWLVASWDADIQGETQDEKIESIRKKLPMWAMVELSKKMQEINGLSMSEVAIAKKVSKAKESAS